MPSTTAVSLSIRGVDTTRRVFASVRKNLALMASQARVAATATAGAVAGIGAAIRASANSFGTLSDRAAQANVAASSLYALSNGLQIAGAKSATIDSLTDALSRMTKATGRTGVEGLKETVAEIAAIPEEGARVQQLQAIFGRAFGPGLAALVRNGSDAARAEIDKLIAAGPRVSDSLVSVGDAIADGMASAWANVRTGWNESWVEIGATFADHFGKPQRQFWADIGAYVRFFVQTAFRHGETLFQNFKTVFGEEGIWGLVQKSVQGWIASIVSFAEKAGAAFVWLKDVVKSAFTDATVADANAKFQEAVDAANERTRLVKDYLDEIYTGEGLKAALPDISDLRAGLELDLSKNAAGILDDIQGVAADTATAVEETTAAARHSLGALQQARAIAANSYEAFRVSTQSTSARSPADRAALRTADNTATAARNSAAQVQILTRIANALDNGGDYAVIA